MIHPDVVDLPTATAWLRKAWGSLPEAPTRLHVRDIEDGSQLGSHAFTRAFMAVLQSQPFDELEVRESVMCGHPRLRSDNPYDCPDCLGEGYYENRVRRYRSPMAAALHRLSKVPAPSIGTPAPVHFVLALSEFGWDWHTAALAIDVRPISADHAETVKAQFLLAIRQCRQRYSEGPIARVSYVDKSASQQAAEDAA